MPKSPPAGGQPFLPAGGQLPKSPHVGGQLPESPHVGGLLPESPHVGGQLPESTHVGGPLPESPHVRGQLPESPHVRGQLPESPHVGGQLLKSPPARGQSLLPAGGQLLESPPTGGQFPKLLLARGQPFLPAGDQSFLPVRGQSFLPAGDQSFLPAGGQSGGFSKSPPARGLSTVLPAAGGPPDTSTALAAKHEEAPECPDEDKLELLVTREEVEQIRGGNWNQDCLDHFLQSNVDTVNYLKFKDCDANILQIQNLSLHVGQCSQPDCFLIRPSNSEAVNLVKLFMVHYKIHHPSAKLESFTAVMLTGKIGSTTNEVFTSAMAGANDVDHDATDIGESNPLDDWQGEAFAAVDVDSSVSQDYTEEAYPLITSLMQE